MMRVINAPVFGAFMLLAIAARASGQSPSPSQTGEDFATKAMNLEEKTISALERQAVFSNPIASPFGERFPWKVDIVTELFYIGEPGAGTASAWDPDWERHYGGIDSPRASDRLDYAPLAFIPHENPFYCELPYNDVAHQTTKPEARLVIPWYKKSSTKPGQSVCLNRWVEIRSHSGRICYAQWSDCGPVRTDDWKYVFGDERPMWNTRHGAGLGVSPAVRDFLGLSELDVTSWRFVEYRDVPPGPWSTYGKNNDFLTVPK